MIALLKQVVGENSFDQAVKKLNGKYEIESSGSNLASSQNKNSGSGTLESMLANQIKVFEKSMHKHVKSFMDRTEKAEESFLDRLDIAGRHRLGSIDLSETSNRKSLLPDTINLPELSVVRVQDRRGGFDTTTSSIDIPPSILPERSSFERRRRTQAGSIGKGLIDNHATD